MVVPASETEEVEAKSAFFQQSAVWLTGSKCLPRHQNCHFYFGPRYFWDPLLEVLLVILIEITSTVVNIECRLDEPEGLENTWSAQKSAPPFARRLLVAPQFCCSAVQQTHTGYIADLHREEKLIRSNST